MSDRERIKAALEVAVRFGGIDGAHHKSWVIDQMVRCLTGCPKQTVYSKGLNNMPYTYEALGMSDEYLKLVAEAKSGEDGPDSYSWESGIAP